MNRTRSIMLCAMLFMVGALVTWKGGSPGQPIKIPLRMPSAYARKLLGDRTMTILQGATRAEVYRIGQASPQVSSAGTVKRKSVDSYGLTAGHGLTAGYDVLSEGRQQGRAFAVRLASVLFSPPTSNIAAACFGPTVAFRVWKAREAVIILVCFHCNNVMISTVDSNGKVIHTLAGDGIEGFWFSRPELLELTKEAFPNDPQIQQLKDEFDLNG